jgi:hypothetical protein
MLKLRKVTNRANKGAMLMVKRKHELGDWHHRAPDFKLVYCGPKNRAKEEAKEFHEERIVEASITNEKPVAVVEKLLE